MPESVKNRPSAATEEIFLFAKSSSYYYNADGVREQSGANLKNYWALGPDPGGKGHPAAFPRELVRRCILLGAPPDSIVLDPFGGSGTTAVAAMELGRKALVIEINPSYVQTCLERTDDGKDNPLRLYGSTQSVSRSLAEINFDDQQCWSG